MKTFKQCQEIEAQTWCLKDPKQRRDKAIREFIRYPQMIKQMGLNYLDTSEMVVWDIGAGAVGGVSQLLNCRQALCIDSLVSEYRKYFACTNYEGIRAEELAERLSSPDLIIITNALDHFENPVKFLEDLNKYAKYSCFFAHLHCIDNAYSHKHEAHAFNVNPAMMKEKLTNWECVWNNDYQNDGLVYGWLKQPAFAQLFRKVC